MKRKISARFPKKTQDLLNKSSDIKRGIAGSAYFRNRSPEFEAEYQRFCSQLENLQVAYDEAKSKDIYKVAHCKACQQELYKTLDRLIRHVELVAEDDEEKIKASGFDLIKSMGRRIGPPIPPGIPVIQLKHSGVSGVMIAYGKPIPGAVAYELQITSGDPYMETGYTGIGILSNCHGVAIPGLTAGSCYAVRGRCHGPGGTSPWSPPFTLMSL